MTTPIGSDDAYPEQIATEFVRTARNSEQEWKNRALAAELNLTCEKRDSREVIGELQKELDAAIRERGSYKESAESWSTRAAQEQLRAEQAECELDKLLDAIHMNVVFTPGETDAEGVERTCVELRELVTMYSRERNTARQSRARLIPLIRHYQEYEKASLKVIRGLRILFKAANRAKRRMRWQRNAWKNIADVITSDARHFMVRYFAVKESRARLVQLWQARGISARPWHAAERTWKP